MFLRKQGSLLRKLKLGLVHSMAEGDQGGGGSGDGGSGGGDNSANSGGDGAGGDGNDWVSSLPESVQGWDEVKNSDSADKFWDQIANQRSRMGRSITIPGEDAGAEDIQAFHDKLANKVPGLVPAPDLENAETMTAHYRSLGMPEKPDGYTIPEVKIDGFDGELDMSQAESFRDIAHSVGLNNKQFETIIDSFVKSNVAATQEAFRKNAEAHQELQKEWGADYNRRMSIATNLAKLTDAPEGLYDLLKGGRGTPAEYKWLYGLATRFKGEGSNLADDGGTNQPAMTPDEAGQKIAEIQNNKEHPYWDKTKPGHKEAVKRMQELYQLKHPG